MTASSETRGKWKVWFIIPQIPIYGSLWGPFWGVNVFCLDASREMSCIPVFQFMLVFCQAFVCSWSTLILSLQNNLHIASPPHSILTPVPYSCRQASEHICGVAKRKKAENGSSSTTGGCRGPLGGMVCY